MLSPEPLFKCCLSVFCGSLFAQRVDSYAPCNCVLFFVTCDTVFMANVVFPVYTTFSGFILMFKIGQTVLPKIVCSLNVSVASPSHPFWSLLTVLFTSSVHCNVLLARNCCSDNPSHLKSSSQFLTCDCNQHLSSSRDIVSLFRILHQLSFDLLTDKQSFVL